jgi:uncharacterized metal-binding protein (TIGR02443 family)
MAGVLMLSEQDGGLYPITVATDMMVKVLTNKRVMGMRNKRFIAGAVCPQCKLADKIFIYLNDADDQWRACASWDFEESLAEAIASQQEEIPTRVNQNRLGEQPLAHEVAVEAVKFIDPK